MSTIHLSVGNLQHCSVVRPPADTSAISAASMVARQVLSLAAVSNGVVRGRGGHVTDDTRTGTDTGSTRSALTIQETAIEDFPMNFTANMSSAATRFTLARMNGIVAYEACRITRAPVQFHFPSPIRTFFQLPKANSARDKAADGAGSASDDDAAVKQKQHAASRKAMRQDAKDSVLRYVLATHEGMKAFLHHHHQQANNRDDDSNQRQQQNSTPALDADASSTPVAAKRGKSRAPQMAPSSPDAAHAATAASQVPVQHHDSDFDRADAVLAAMYCLANHLTWRALTDGDGSVFRDFVASMLNSALAPATSTAGSDRASGAPGTPAAAAAKLPFRLGRTAMTPAQVPAAIEALCKHHRKVVAEEQRNRHQLLPDADAAAGGAASAAALGPDDTRAPVAKPKRRKGSKKSSVANASGPDGGAVDVALDPDAVERLYARMRSLFGDSVRQLILDPANGVTHWRPADKVSLRAT